MKKRFSALLLSCALLLGLWSPRFRGRRGLYRYPDAATAEAAAVLSQPRHRLRRRLRLLYPNLTLTRRAVLQMVVLTAGPGERGRRRRAQNQFFGCDQPALGFWLCKPRAQQRYIMGDGAGAFRPDDSITFDRP